MPFVNAVKDPPKERKNVRSWIASSGETVFELKSVSTKKNSTDSKIRPKKVDVCLLSHDWP